MLALFEAWPLALPMAALLLGLVVGSFLNVVAYRLPLMMERAWRAEMAEYAAAAADAAPPENDSAAERFDLMWPGSACPHCGQPIAARHNVPVLSWLWLRGRCAACRERIAPRYPIVEALTAAASVTVTVVLGPGWEAVAALGLTWALIALTLIDLDHQLLPDSITLPLVWAGLLISLWPAPGGPLFASLDASVIGAAAGYLSLWSVYWLFRLATGKEGMGYGDFKLLAALGAWLGWQQLPLIILLSAAVGSVVGIAMIVLLGRSRQIPIPFGPYLAAAGWISLLWGEGIVAAYLGLVG